VIAWPWLDNASLAALKDEMDLRWGPLRQNDGQAVIVKSGTFGQVMNYAASHNNRGITILPSEGSPTLPWVDAAASAGVLAYYANIDPARGFNTLAIPGVLAPAEKDRWSDWPEKNQALFEGVSVRYVDPDGNVCFSKVITTYRFNALGAEDIAYLSINSCFTLSYLRYDWNNYIKLKYPRHKLAEDADAARFGRGQAIMTPKLAKAEAVSRFMQWLEAGLVEGSAQFAADLITEINQPNPNRLDVFMRPNLVNQFEICGTLIRHII
jgi:phage tail sheath gpL-like